MVDHSADTFLASWVAGMDYLAKLFPPWLVREFKSGIRQIPPQKPPEPPWPRFSFFEHSDDSLRFPLIEQAARRLADREILTRYQWDRIEEAAKQKAFFVTAPIEAETIRRIRDALVYEIDEGASLDSFRNRIDEELDGSPLGASHLENVYRTNIQAAFRDGRETLASNPIVEATFPYQEYMAIHDARARHDHLIMEELGLNGTNVYRRDDPVWEYFTPPWDFQCRCGVNLLTIEAAAQKGVREAKEWLKTGKPPLYPEHRIQEVLKHVKPVPGFGQRGIVYA
jgi:hypothetical protein